MLTLIVEDDPDWAAMISSAIATEADDIAIVETATQAARFVRLKPPDFLVIDAMLPDGSGLDLCARLRAELPDTPSILVSSLDRPTDRVDGLLRGADDYLAKPFHPTELRVRVEAIRRRYRYSGQNAVLDRPAQIAAGELLITLDPPSVRIAGVDAHFTPTEARLLGLMVRYRGHTLRHDFIAEEVWGYNDKSSHGLVKVHMASIRRKLRTYGGDAGHLRTIHGVGYCFSTPEDAT